MSDLSRLPREAGARGVGRWLPAGLVPATAAVVLLAGTTGQARQSASVERLPAEVFDVAAPSGRVSGTPGRMRVSQSGCAAGPAVLDAALRRRIVDIAVQEWAFFGFGVVDQTAVEPARRTPPSLATPVAPSRRGRFGWLSADEAARVASSIAGYWTVTAEGAWIIDQQNDQWNGRAGLAARWQSPWSAAFVSWVMCESGLSDAGVFQRAVAHHRYIDQAIRARDGAAPQAAFVAYDSGEQPVEPGDLLCSGRRPAYLTLSERRRQIGEGARTHCDIVVKVDAARARILAIGGNVRSSVSLKVLPAGRGRDGSLRPFDFSDAELDDNPYRGARPIFAHLKLRAGAVGADALDWSPTIRTLACNGGLSDSARPVLSGLVTLRPGGC